jgi:hypothetical protein
MFPPVDLTQSVRRSARNRDSGFVATLAKLEDGHAYVDEEGDVVAEFGPGGVGAEFDALDLGGPVLGEEDVVDAVGAIFVVVEIAGG